ncbi:hypothetical protein QBC44DRAFT_309605 [Cladorrhinum sp. PSN332]|nr:hypothetical protein QBC44DRAFT_309605 [Cladorrhinum sp. PSN332]
MDQDDNHKAFYRPIPYDPVWTQERDPAQDEAKRQRHMDRRRARDAQIRAHMEQLAAAGKEQWTAAREQRERDRADEAEVGGGADNRREPERAKTKEELLEEENESQRREDAITEAEARRRQRLADEAAANAQRTLDRDETKRRAEAARAEYQAKIRRYVEELNEKRRREAEAKRAAGASHLPPPRTDEDRERRLRSARELRERLAAERLARETEEVRNFRALLEAAEVKRVQAREQEERQRADRERVAAERAATDRAAADLAAAEAARVKREAEEAAERAFSDAHDQRIARETAAREQAARERREQEEHDNRAFMAAAAARSWHRRYGNPPRGGKSGSKSSGG